jgi:threonylcarbamoyladenosine tRNA methylthiotransferase MtaB
MKIAFTTLGCKVNQFDTAIMSEAVSKERYQVVSYEESADIYVINSCTVTDNADFESRHWVKKARQQNPNAKIVVTGCYAQTNPSEVKQIPGVHLVVGNEEKKSLSSLIDILGTSNEPISCVGEIAREKVFSQPLLESFLDKTRAFLKVQDGCNFWCSFCIIPKARGRSRSFPIKDVVEQVLLFEEKGYREVVFSGINLGSYGLDLNPKSSLFALFKQVEKESRSIRFRFSSIEPDLLTEELIDAFTASQRVCRHFHIPLQSGDPQILKRMNRKYTPENYRKIIDKIHRQMPRASIGVDVMVGFPGETEWAFQNSYRLLSDLPLSYFHVFPYSPREGTAALEFTDQTAPAKKKERAHQLRRLGKTKAEAFRAKFIGTELEVTIEDFDKGDPKRKIKGLTDNYLKVLIENGEKLNPNDQVTIFPHSQENDYLVGRLIS